jgi:hypothetical protein
MLTSYEIEFSAFFCTIIYVRLFRLIDCEFCIYLAQHHSLSFHRRFTKFCTGPRMDPL